MKNNYCFINMGPDMGPGSPENPQMRLNHNLEIPKRERRKIEIEVGDTNYVAPGEYFLVLDKNNEPTALLRRNDSLELEPVMSKNFGDIELPAT